MGIDQELFDYESGVLYGGMLGNGRLNVALDTSLNVRRVFNPIDTAHDAAIRFGTYDEQGMRWFDMGNAGMRNFILLGQHVEMFVDELEPVLAMKVAILSSMSVPLDRMEKRIRLRTMPLINAGRSSRMKGSPPTRHIFIIPHRPHSSKNCNHSSEGRS